jgi:LemA protein
MKMTTTPSKQTATKQEQARHFAVGATSMGLKTALNNTTSVPLYHFRFNGEIDMRKFLALLLTLAILGLSGCGYNTFQTGDEQIKASWSEVVNQYQRRADLIPNLVSTVKGEAKFEQDTLTKVIEARSRATSIQATPELINDPAAFQKFQQAQGELTGALSRLLVVSENYPSLRANQGFRDLQAQLEGTENRITVARNRYIKSVQAYNVTVRSFPSNLTAMVFGYREKPNFTVENEKEISRPPSVSFDAAPAAPKIDASGAAR